MGWWGNLFGSKPPSFDAATPDQNVVPRPTMREFAEFEGTLSPPQALWLAGSALGMVQADTRPDELPFEVLEAMGWHPTIYLGEMLVSWPARDPDLFFVEHKDEEVKSEVEAWLRPLLPSLLPMIARAFFLGVSPLVAEWGQEDLILQSESGRKRTLRRHTHYVRVNDLWPNDVQLELHAKNRRRLIGIRFAGRLYRAGNEAFVPVWDQQFGWWQGKGSRRRCYRPWFDSMAQSVWKNRYLERSVDPPRIGYAPKGKITVNGTEIQTTSLLARAIMALRNGGATVLPGDFDPEANERIWGIDFLNLPDRSEVWHRALSREDAQMLVATLVPPTAAGLEGETFAGGRVAAGLLTEVIQLLANFVACELTKIIRPPHLVAHGLKVPAPVVKANAVPQAMRKLLLDVFRVVADVPRMVEDGKEVTLAEMVDDSLIDQLGLKKIPASKAAREKKEPAAPPPGREREATSDREERRDSAREPEGEDAVGGDDEQIDE